MGSFIPFCSLQLPKKASKNGIIKNKQKKKQRKKNPKPCQHFLCVIIGGNRQMNALSFSGDLQLRMCDERDIILYLAIQYAC